MTNEKFSPSSTHQSRQEIHMQGPARWNIKAVLMMIRISGLQKPIRQQITERILVYST